MSKTSVVPSGPRSNETSTDRAMVISSDGHAAANMVDYRKYLPSRVHGEFDAFCELYAEHGARATDASTLSMRLDPESVDQWSREVINENRLDGISDPASRIAEMDRDGRAADVLFPDFGIPFELASPFRSALVGYAGPTKEQLDAALRAHNRWLVDYCSIAPHRFAAQASVGFDDVDAAVKEIRWAHGAGLRGLILPVFADDVPVFDPRFEPIWNTLEELGMPLNSHAGISTISQPRLNIVDSVPHPACVHPMWSSQQMFFCHQLLHHMIWGGVLERHPNLNLILTEQGSGWVLGELQAMDYSYDGSYLRRDLRDVIRHKPSEYFVRQCSLGSSIFSKAEIDARHQIGVDKIMLGMDYPHQEGTWAMGPGTLDYFQATLGAAHVPAQEARLMLGETAAEVFGMDVGSLLAEAERIGPRIEVVLSPPTEDLFPRGDVKKPIGTSF
jgi:predicted TIM-barrel fold metal-dependent hydrolase